MTPGIGTPRPASVGRKAATASGTAGPDIRPGNPHGALPTLPAAPGWRAQAASRPAADAPRAIDKTTQIEAQLNEIYDETAGMDEADDLQEQLAWCAAMLPLVAMQVDRKAPRMEKEGRLHRDADGDLKPCKDENGSDRKGPLERKADKLKQRSAKLGAKLRLKKRRAGHTLGTGQFLTPDKHVKNYVVGATGSIGKELAFSAGESQAPCMGDLVSLVTLPVHAAFIDNVSASRKALNEKAGTGVALGLRNAATCLVSLQRGEMPPLPMMKQWMLFWNDVAVWNKTAEIVVAAGRASAKHAPEQRLAFEQLAAKLARKGIADGNQTEVGWLRDVLGLVPLELYALTRGLDYVAGLDVAGYLGPFGVLAGGADYKQGDAEAKAAAISKVVARWRRQQLREELAGLHGEPLRGKVVESLIGMFGREKRRADYEVVSAEVRKFYGMTRVVSGSLMTASVAAPPLAPLLAPAGVAVGTAGQAIFSLTLALRQYLRWCKTHGQKSSERDFRQWLGTHGGGDLEARWEALNEPFMEGFSTERGIGDLVDGQKGFARVHKADYAAGGNEIMALEVMAWDIVAHQALTPGAGDSYFMGLLGRRLGLPPVNKLFMRNCVQEFLYQDQADAAIEFVSGVIRKLLEGPASRAAEPLHASAFVAAFEAAQEEVRRRMTAPGDDRVDGVSPEQLLEQVFFAPNEDGTAIDPQLFARSMEGLRNAWETRYAEVERTGVYAQMLDFHRDVQARRHAPSRIDVHTARWAEWSDFLGLDTTRVADHAAIHALLLEAQKRPGATWPAQLKAAIAASTEDPLKRCEALLGSLRRLAGADVVTPPFVARFASELRLELRGIAADIGGRLHPASFDSAGWMRTWAGFKVPADASNALRRATKVVGYLLDRLDREEKGSLAERLPNALHDLARGVDVRGLAAGLLADMELFGDDALQLSWPQKQIVDRLMQALAGWQHAAAPGRGADGTSIAALRQQWLDMPDHLLADGELKELHAAVDEALERAGHRDGTSWQDQLRDSLMAPPKGRQVCEALLARVELLGKSEVRKSPGAASVLDALRQALQPMAAEFRWLDVSAFDAELWVQAWQEQVAQPVLAAEKGAEDGAEKAAYREFAREARLVAGLLERLADSEGKSLEARLPAALDRMERSDFPRPMLVRALRDALGHLRALPQELPWFQQQMTLLLESALRGAKSR